MLLPTAVSPSLFLKALYKIQKSFKHKPETRILGKSWKVLFFPLPDSVKTVKPLYVNLCFYGGLPGGWRTYGSQSNTPPPPPSKVTDPEGAALIFRCTYRSSSESFAEPSPRGFPGTGLGVRGFSGSSPGCRPEISLLLVVGGGGGGGGVFRFCLL